MCWFLTAAVRAEHASSLEAMGRRRGGLGVRPSVNPHVARIFPPDYALFELTHGGCSCDLFGGARELDPPDLDRRRRQYRQRGWSESKIARALAAAEESHSRSSVTDRTSGVAAMLRREIAERVDADGNILLFAHCYSGSVDEEHVVANGRTRMTTRAFLADDIPGDVLIEVVRGG